jgi:molybdopterin/thiamine biosynthesis adenylyltransferase/rhodanese-related sulfurtransferase
VAASDTVDLLRLGAAHRTDTERVPLLRARGRVLADAVITVRSGLRAELRSGHRLTATDLGALAEAGHAEVPVARRPTVAVFTGGDGLRPPGVPLAPGERFDACRALLMALLQEAGLEPVAWPILPAAPDRAEGALADAAQAFDLVIACVEADERGDPRWAPLLATDSAHDAIPMALTPASPGSPSAPPLRAWAAARGARAPRSLCLLLPEDAATVANAWSSTGARLIDAMQGVVERGEEVRAASRPPSPGGFAAEGRDALELDVAEAGARFAAGATLIDVREPHEHALGVPDGAIALPLSQLESGAAALPAALASGKAVALLLCASGQRSLRAAALLRTRGVAAAFSVRGGAAAWQAERGSSPGALGADALDRYDRQLRLAGVGAEGQRRLLDARVVVVGAGGLGSPAAFYLAAAGVGTLALVDDDRVERSNLQRQILHTDRAVGVPKVASARERLLALNPSLRVDAVEARVGPDNVEALLRGADVVIDGSDTFAARYLLDAACRELGIPLVYGAVERFTGQVAVFDAGRRRGAAPCYRCLFPEPPDAEAAPNCAEAGVLGVLPGLVGLLQATEALKLILGLGEPLVGRVLTVDALSMRFRTLELPVDARCPGCGADARFDGYAAIDTFCASR